MSNLRKKSSFDGGMTENANSSYFLCFVRKNKEILMLFLNEIYD
jgi:hypothetical protein